jgi:hypothetical protein
MVVRVRRGKSGMSKYLRDGKKAGSIYSRDQKDVVTPIYGCLDDFERAENYCVENKNWAENYMHITFGFSDNDWQKIESLPSKEEQNALMQELIKDYLSHHFSAYDIDKELIFYSELHNVKLKYDENGNKRYPHIHLGVSFLNLLSDTKIRNLFSTNSYLDKLITRRSHLKFGFEEVKKRDFKIQKYETKIGKNRADWAKSLEYLDNREELIEFLEKHLNFKENIDYKIVETKNNNYVKLINKSFRKDKQGEKIIESLNLRGHPFERFVDMNTDVSHKRIEDMTQEELEEILNDVYAKRVEEIGKRRSKKATEDLKKIYEDDEKLKKDFQKKYSQKSDYNSFKSLTFQQKIILKHYGVKIEDSLRGYYVKTDDTGGDNITFINHSKGIKVQDKGDEIVSYSNASSIQDEVELMVQVALSKGWNLLLDIQVDGTPEFIKEAKKQILKKVEEQNKKGEKNATVEIKKVEKPIRPISQLDNYILENESKIFESEKVLDIQFLKKNLPAQVVLDFAKQKYNINLEEFEVGDGNKINNKTNRQKPKSIIDFFTKEIGISIKEATEICNDLMTKQPKVIDEVKGEEKLEELVQQHQELQNKDSKNKQIEINQEEEEVKHHSKNKQNKNNR